MSSLRYVGPAALNPDEIVTRKKLTDDLNAATPNRTSVSSEIVTQASAYGTKSYVDTQDNQFPLANYYQNQDALNVPLGAKGAANGVATLDANGQIPLAQLPTLGSSYIYGPFGPTALFSGSTKSTPLKIADFNIGVQSIQFQPLAFAIIMAQSINNGRPVVEFRISNGAAPYASQALIGQAMGRNFYDDLQPITMLPSPQTTGQSGTAAGFPTSYNTWISVWLYDAAGQTVTLGTGGVVTIGVFLMRLAE